MMCDENERWEAEWPQSKSDWDTVEKPPTRISNIAVGSRNITIEKKKGEEKRDEE